MKLYTLNTGTMEIKEFECEGLYGKTMYILEGRRQSLKTQNTHTFKSRAEAVEQGKSIIKMRMNDLQILLNRLER